MAGRSGSIRISNAHVLTMDPERPTARAVVIHDGCIEFVGSDEGARLVDRGVDEHLDAGGRTVIPGFNDAHGHFIHEGLLARRADLADTKSLGEALTLVRAHAAAHPDDEVIIAERWDESSWPERRFPTRRELDEIVPDRPLLLRRVDGHVAVANRALLDLYDARWNGDRSLIDHETGILLEEPALTFNELFPPRPAELDEAAARFVQIAARHGVTSGQEFATPQHWRAWQRLRRRRDRAGEDLGLRLDVSTYVEYLDHYVGAGLMTGAGDDWLAVGGVKIFADGSFGARSAYTQEPYADDPHNHGVPTFDDETLQRHVGRAHDAGLQLRMHVIGDASIEQGTRAFEAVAETAGLDAFRGLRHRFEHYELSHPEQRRRAKTLGLVLSMQPNFIGSWATAEGMYGSRLGVRHRQTNPVRTILAEGLPVAFGSDTMPFGPLIGLRGVMGAPYPEMQLDFQASVRCYTVGAAYAQHREHVKGMLRPGMLGDCVVLSKDMGALDPNDVRSLDGLDVRATVLDGRVVHGAA